MTPQDGDVVVTDEHSAQRMRHELALTRALVLIGHADVVRITELSPAVPPASACRRRAWKRWPTESRRSPTAAGGCPPSS